MNHFEFFKEKENGVEVIHCVKILCDYAEVRWFRKVGFPEGTSIQDQIQPPRWMMEERFGQEVIEYDQPFEDFLKHPYRELPREMIEQLKIQIEACKKGTHT